MAQKLARRTALWLVVFSGIFGYFFLRYVVWKLPAFAPLPVGPFRLTPFGSLVALGVLFGVHLTRQWCERFAMDWPKLRDGLFWIVGGGFLVAHVGSILAYSPAHWFTWSKYADPNTGLFSFGGFLGGLGAAIWYCKKQRLAVWAYVDCLLYGLVGGWLFGRLGCFSVHDHPGQHTDLPTGVLIHGTLRHDLGFYELLYTMVLFSVLTWSTRRGKPFDGFVVAVTACGYALVRFCLDFLRTGDSTYGGLTPAQWACVPLLAIGIYAVSRGRRQSPQPAE
jgi:phosphatidylglycerol:prolipoprotein diacylglycerol transferase